MIKITKRFEAFGLIEASFVIVIFGILSSVLSCIISNMSIKINSIRTKNSLEYAMIAISQYVYKNKKFPCPAENEDGESMKSCNASNEISGYLPHKTLNISKKLINTPNNKPLSYIVNGFLTINYKKTNLNNFCKYESLNSVLIGFSKDQSSISWDSNYDYDIKFTVGNFLAFFFKIYCE
jgi:type II secretory pathway pseudopilin PulG